MADRGRWFPDPTGRGDRRYWDGVSWTDQVTRRGISATDFIPRGYAGPEQFCFHEQSSTRVKAVERPVSSWRDAFGRLHGT